MTQINVFSIYFPLQSEFNNELFIHWTIFSVKVNDKNQKF